MKRTALFLIALISLSAQRRPQPPPPIQPTEAELREVRAKVEQIESLLSPVKAKLAGQPSLADVEVYAKAGRMLLEFPEDFFTQDGINHLQTVLNTGIERARELAQGRTPWIGVKGRQTYGLYSGVDGSVEPYGVSIPDSYDGKTPARLYVWMHGRDGKLTESEFLHAYPGKGPSKPPVAEIGQISVDVYGRWNGAGWHWAGETEVFETIAAVQQRFKIDPNRILLRGFSMGGEGAWHIALHHPDRFAAAEIGAGTRSRRALMPGLTPYQLATLRIWENMEEWALNAFNLPVAGHDGDNDTQVCCLPPPQGVKTRGQLESSLMARDQLVKEGFKLEGDPNFFRVLGTPSIFLISKDTGHGTSPLTRQRLDAFLKENGDRGLQSPDQIRFLTYTTRYNKDFWVTVDGLEKHYERADINVTRTEGGKRYDIATNNISRLTLNETGKANEIRIDGQTLKVKPAAFIGLEKIGSNWRIAAKHSGLRKTHALQGPIDDAFLDPFLIVRPTGIPWSLAVDGQLKRTIARFDRLYAKFLRAHPRIIDDKDLKASDFAKYHVVLFGDPGSNKWIAKMAPKLPITWKRDFVSIGTAKYSASDHFPALIYPNPLNPAHYVVINTALTIDDREYRGDYGMPKWGDYAVVKVNEAADTGEAEEAGLFDEHWRLQIKTSAANPSASAAHPAR